MVLYSLIKNTERGPGLRDPEYFYLSYDTNNISCILLTSGPTLFSITILLPHSVRDQVLRVSSYPRAIIMPGSLSYLLIMFHILLRTNLMNNKIKSHVLQYLKYTIILYSFLVIIMFCRIPL